MRLPAKLTNERDLQGSRFHATTFHYTEMAKSRESIHGEARNYSMCSGLIKYEQQLGKVLITCSLSRV